jgi:pimeloyl-ACP methyl ester carboxylesterase
VAYDQRGHGESAPPRDGTYSIEALAGDLEAVRRSLALDRVVLVGHSISGEVVTAYAAAHPERVAGIVYVDASGDFGALPRERREATVRRDAGFSRLQWKAEWEEMLGADARPMTRRIVLADLEKVDVRALAAMRADSLFFPARERAARYTGPRVAIEVDDPPGAELRAAALDRAIRLVTVRGVSHWLMLDDPASFNRILAEALVAMP